jgi:ferredoxin-NADP reductase
VAGTAVLGRLTWLVANVVDIVTETPRVKTIAFDVPGWPGHRAGQHVDVRLAAEDGYQAQRSYSIASAPDGVSVELTVERLDDGEVSPYLTDELRPGDQIELRGPIGGYFVCVIHTLTRSHPPGWTGYARRVDAEMLAEVGPSPVERPRVHVCGSTPFVEAVAGRSSSLDTSRNQSRRNASDRRETEMDALMLDGNAVAGLLQEVFAVEVTTAIGMCNTCGATEAVGALHVFRGAGIVMRCPHCHEALVTIVEDDTRVWVGFPGIRRLQVTV